ncbi:hypothetical protein FB451DRAFT_1569521 [Mycena latifolia]|nr:hypothetical protein FB451DRAFT_1569521 [Mycena latifolia]
MVMHTSQSDPDRGRYHTDQVYIFQIAPSVLRAHQLILRVCTAFEDLYYLASLPQFFLLSSYTEVVLLSGHTSLRATPLFVAGVIAVVLGASIRLICFHALGELFTFDLSVLPQHRLSTTGPSRCVRHPAYTGSLTVIVGLAFSHLSPGSWLFECGPLHRRPASGVAIGAVWWLWTLGLLNRAEAEDKEMRMLFPDQADNNCLGTLNMHAKFASLTVLFSVLFTSQAVGAVPKAIDCSKVFCPATRCPLGKTAEALPGACCATCVKCSGICPEFILLCPSGTVFGTLPGECCPTSCIPVSTY